MIHPLPSVEVIFMMVLCYDGNSGVFPDGIARQFIGDDGWIGFMADDIGWGKSNLLMEKHCWMIRNCFNSSDTKHFLKYFRQNLESEFM